MIQKTKPFNGLILDKIISYFNNNITICGSLCDYAHIGYSGKINDFDFIISESIFFEYLHIEKLDNNIISKDFTLRRKKTQTYNKISYIGTYQDIYSIDIFLTDQRYKTEDICTLISSNIFYENSKYSEYQIHSIQTRKNKLQELLVLANKKENNPPKWLQTWKQKKISQVNEKLPLYNSLEAERKNSRSPS